ncbi:DUF1499 domain-containing protein [Candidatus Poseidonia sp.]|nr:DUF1499 domain-containing protein [Poseidonia sp.]
MTSQRWKSLGLVALLLMTPWLFVQGWILVSAPTPDHTTLPTCPEGTQNCASIGEGGLVRMEATFSATMDANVSEVWAAFESWSDDEDLILEYDSIGEDGEHFSHRVAITPFWRFPDDVVVKFTPVDEQSTSVSLYSSSRLGVSDLGVNPDRLTDLHEALMKA